ncbi:MAG: hypothetical protein Q8R00_04735 [Candidatus Nanoarchaeia archaeon]|nr:hypothetical protein [Candidatus Nanoarchaeia archaeon]
MDFRKLIKFGNSSHVISLPRDWLTKNKLDKGDVIYFHQNGGNELVLTPAEPKSKKEDREIVIDANKKAIETIKRELTSAYIRGFNVIKITDNNLKERAVEIRNELQNLMALEIMEQTQTSMVARDMLNVNDVNLNTLLRRMDMTTRSMMTDLKEAIKETSNTYEHFSYRDQDINRTYFVVLRLTNLGMSDLAFANSIKLTPKDLFKIWGVGYYLESLADEVKRIAELLNNTKINKKTKEYLLRLFNDIEASYFSVMKAYYTGDIQLALQYSDARKKLFEKTNELYKELNRNPDNLRVLAICERFNNMIESINKISRKVYDFG